MDALFVGYLEVHLDDVCPSKRDIDYCLLVITKLIMNEHNCFLEAICVHGCEHPYFIHCGWMPCQ